MGSDTGTDGVPDAEVDRLALRALVDTYAAAADARDVKRFVGLFLPDATLSAYRGEGEPTRYVGAIRLAEIPEKLGRYRHTYHDVGHHWCHIEGDQATGEAGCRAHHVSEIPGGTGATDLVLTIRYRDAYTRTPEGWRFATREVHIIWTSEEPVTVV